MVRAMIAIPFALALTLPAAAAKEQWVRINSPDFEVFTSAPEREGRELLRNFQQIRGFFEKASPVPLLEQFPVRIIVFGSKDRYQPYAPNAAVVAYATSSRQTDCIVMQEASPESNGYAVHEYMHLLVRHSGLNVPVWLNEGWADVYSTLRPVRGGVAVGDLIARRVSDLESEEWLSFEALTSVTQDSPTYREGNRIGVFYAQSWALVHMLFLSPEYSANFPKFLIALHRGRSAGEAAQEAWGRSPEQLFADLHSYFTRKKLYGRVFEAPLGKSERGIVVSKLADFDSRLLLADLQAAIGHTDQARTEYAELEQTNPGNAELSESLGYFALRNHDTQAARGYFETAFATGRGDARMCYELALLERAARRPDQAEAALERAIRSKPDYADALVQLGVIRLAARRYQGAIDALMSIRKVTPLHATPLFTALAYAYFETGDLDKARSNALTAKKYALIAKQESGVDELLGIIDARAKGPFAPKPGEPTERMEGVLQTVECAAGGNRLTMLVGQTNRVFELPDPKAVEFIHTGGGAGLQLSCGPQQPMRLVVDFAPASNVVRRLEY